MECSVDLSVINSVYYRLKFSIFNKNDSLFVTVNYNEFACGQKDVRCVSMA